MPLVYGIDLLDLYPKRHHCYLFCYLQKALCLKLFNDDSDRSAIHNCAYCLDFYKIGWFRRSLPEHQVTLTGFLPDAAY